MQSEILRLQNEERNKEETELKVMRERQTTMDQLQDDVSHVDDNRTQSALEIS